MKRLILMGGRPRLGDRGGKDFVNVLLRYFPKEASIAFYTFAQLESGWEQTSQNNIDRFERFANSHSFSYQTMTPKNFVLVSDWANIIDITGGNPFVLYERLTAQSNISRFCKDKVIVGSSASADVLCVQYVYLQDKTSWQDLGWIRAVCIPYWRDSFEGYMANSWDRLEQESVEHFPALAALCIPEDKFTEFSVA